MTRLPYRPEKPAHRDPLRRFLTLMPRRVKNALLVGSRYDAFLLNEDVRAGDGPEFAALDPEIESAPRLRRESTGRGALSAAEREDFDLVVLTPHVRDMDALHVAARLHARAKDLPIVPLVFDEAELEALTRPEEAEVLERPFVWQGDSRLLPAIVHSIEDRWNVEHDTRRAGVSVVLLIEDGVHDYSSLLPMLYAELTKQSQRVISEELNLEGKRTRLRARPKILHCTTFEQAEAALLRHRDFLLGVVSDLNFPMNGTPTPDAGILFARKVRERLRDLPLLLQSRDPGLEERAAELHAAVALKGSPHLMQQLSRFVLEGFGFGDFVFRLPDGSEIGRAKDIRTLEDALRTLPDASVRFHAERDHFSTWLRARTEFRLASGLRRRRMWEFPSVGAARDYLVATLEEFRRERQCGVISEFDPRDFHSETTFARIGGGSLGGKARGLAFVRQLLESFRVRRRFHGIEVAVPSAAVLATDAFDRFVESNDLRDFALEEDDDLEIERRFLESRFPEDVFERLLQYVDVARHPLAVRSSSLLEDSPSLPFTGVYRTYMVPNSHPDRAVRVKELVNAIKRVYASTYSQRAKATVRNTPYRLEEEKMAVLLQRMVGARHGRRFYPHFAGVARSWNFYALPPARPEEGIVSVALGLGEMVVRGGPAVRFCPSYPESALASASTSDVLDSAQRAFYALELETPESSPDPSAELQLAELPLAAAIEDGTLAPLASTYSSDDDALHDGLEREGIPLATFAPILKYGHSAFPLAEISRFLLDLGSRAMNRPVEIEFAVDLTGPTREFAFLQLRPSVAARGGETVSVDAADVAAAICFSSRVLGNGSFADVRDLVVVDRERFDRARSRDAARDVARINAKLVAEGRPFGLIGAGRWGASDPWLGVPVTWDAIAGAKVIVESDLKGAAVAPSQGSHFFHNLIAAGVGYFTVGADRAAGFVDWEWLAAQPAAEETPHVRHLRLGSPVLVKMDGREARGVVCRPRPQITP